MRGGAEIVVARLTDILAAPCAESGYAVTAVSLTGAVEISLAKGGATFVLWLKPASDAGAAYRTTARLRIGHRGDPPDQLGYRLLDAACAEIERWDRSLTDDEYTGLFRSQPGSPATPQLSVEWRAVRAGLKPAARDLVQPDAVQQLLEQAGAAGLHARATDAGAYVARFWQAAEPGMTTILYVARTEAALAAVADAERAMIHASTHGRQVTADHVRAVGTALGYPPCCIEAFLAMRQCSNAEIRFAALRRTAGPPSLLLNDLHDRAALVSHLVCRYDCDASLRYARALVQELDPAAARDLENRLGGLMVAFRQGGALRLVPPGHAAPGPYRFVAVEASGDSPAVTAWRSELGGADGVDVLAGSVRVLRAAEEIRRLSAPPDDVQIRLFA